MDIPRLAPIHLVATTLVLLPLAACRLFDDPPGGGLPSSGSHTTPEDTDGTIDTDDPPPDTYTSYLAFAEDYAIGVCQALDTCGYLEHYEMTYDECVELLSDSLGGPCDDFDGDAAWDCMEAIWDLSCADLEQPLPEACGQVCSKT